MSLWEYGVCLLYPVRVPPPRLGGVCASCALCVFFVFGLRAFVRCLLLRVYSCICAHTHVPLIMQQHACAQTCNRTSAETHTQIPAHLDSVCNSLSMPGVYPLCIHAGPQVRSAQLLNPSMRALPCTLHLHACPLPRICTVYTKPCSRTFPVAVALFQWQ